MPTVTSHGQQESDVTISPSPDHKLKAQFKAINMPHDTSKLRGMAVRTQNPKTPTMDRYNFQSRKITQGNMTIQHGSSRVDDFKDFNSGAAIKYEKKLLPKVSP